MSSNVQQQVVVPRLRAAVCLSVITVLQYYSNTSDLLTHLYVQLLRLLVTFQYKKTNKKNTRSAVQIEA